VSYIGWDELLKTRSAVFVMEEEYRAQKAAVDVPPSSTAASGTLAEGNAHESTDSLASADDDASIRGEKSAVDVRRTSAESAEDGEGAIPTIRISSESDRQRAAQKVPNGDAGAKNGHEEAAEDLQTPVAGEVALDEPVKASMRPEGADGEEQTPANPQDAFSFSNKRLCERWLDNLFMVLYEACPSYLCSVAVADQLSRTSGCGRSTGLRSRTSRHSTSRTGRQGSNGRFSATSVLVCTTRKRRRSRTSAR
jgi:hypothetical protein